MSELNKQNKIITYIFELGLIKSVGETREFMRENSSPYVFNCSEPKTIRFEWFLSEDEKSATLIEMFEDSDAAKLRLENHSESHLVKEFPEYFEIKNFIVLGDIKPDMKDKLADWNADLRGNVGGFFKGLELIMKNLSTTTPLRWSRFLIFIKLVMHKEFYKEIS